MVELNCVKRAAKEQVRFALAASLFVVAYVSFLAVSPFAARMEASTFPILSPVADDKTCVGWTIYDDMSERPHNCVIWKAFEQEHAWCVGDDVYVSGYLNKVRDAEFLPNKHEFFLGTPHGRYRRIIFNTDKDHPGSDYFEDGRGFKKSRRPGLQDWGIWRLRGACSPINQRRFNTWFTITHHEPWHNLWELKTVLGPFPLPQRFTGQNKN